jgi:hypothetical protein
MFKGYISHQFRMSILTLEQKRNIIRAMPAEPEIQPASEPDRFEAATDQAIAACGGDARAAVKVLIVANEFLEAQVSELQAAVSKGYVRLPRDRKDWYD